MTVIAAIKGPHGVQIGWDSRISSAGGDAEPCRTTKVWTRGEFALGISGVVGGYTPAIYSKRWPKMPPKIDEFWYANVWLPFVFRATGLSRDPHSIITHLPAESSVLIVYRGTILIGDDHGDVWQPEGDCGAIGSGAVAALAALRATVASIVPPAQRMMQALELAGEFNAYVGPPYHTLHMPNKMTKGGTKGVSL